MPYFAILDSQNKGQIMAIGKNCQNLSDIKDAILSYLSVDHDEEDLENLSKASAHELAGMYEMQIIIDNQPW